MLALIVARGVGCRRGSVVRGSGGVGVVGSCSNTDDRRVVSRASRQTNNNTLLRVGLKKSSVGLWAAQPWLLFLIMRLSSLEAMSTLIMYEFGWGH